MTKPSTSSNLTQDDLNNWNGPYLERWKKNPWGGNYTYKNGSTAPDDSNWSGTKFRWLELDKVPGVGQTPTGAAANLKNDLGSDVVYVPSSGDTVYILISKD
ncbi:MAG: type II secretion system protein GspG [Thermoanaerobacteraceae bacterium]|nr:type II secretion system protein GspG [Thermoanaerobacteraceae bacterium]